METLEELLNTFPDEWDVQVMVCCRGETMNGPLGIRRWMAVAVPRLATSEEIRKGLRPQPSRLTSGCCDDPTSAVLEVRAIIKPEVSH